MSHVTYEIVEHDGGWAYRVDGVYSETFQPTTRPRPRPAARPASSAWPARRAASPGRTPAASWHEEVDQGDDRPDTEVEG